jgi:hypothetical protein
LNQNNEKELKIFNEKQEKFRNTQSFSSTINSLRVGRIPEGVNVKCFFNEEQPVVTAIAIYIPSMTLATKNLKQAMEEASNDDFSPENSSNKGFQPVKIKQRNTGTTKLNDSDVIGGEAPKGVSGQVTNDSDL